MKFIATILILLCASQCLASGWYWQDYGNGYYIKSNGIENDGFLYQRYGTCHPYRYQAVKVLAPVVQYSKDWAVNMANASYQIADKKLFLEAQRELFKQTPGYGSGYEYEYSTIQRGSQFFPLEYNQLDANALAHSLERATLRQSQSVDNSVAALGAATQQAVEANKTVMLFRAFAEGIQPQPTVETHTRTRGSAASSTFSTSAATASSIAGQALAFRHCASCHNGTDKSNPLNITAIPTYSPEERDSIATQSAKAMAEGTMPKNHPKLPDAEQSLIASWIRGPQSSVTYKAQVETLTEEETK
jgi:mono/diheme cytochrome c family protein